MKNKINLNKNNLIKICLYLLALIVLWLVSWFMGCIVAAISDAMGKSLSLNVILKYATTRTALFVGGVVFAILTGFIVYTMTKHKLFNFSKVVDRVDRAKSNMYGSAEFMTEQEMRQAYGYKKDKKFFDYNFSQLKGQDFNGYIVNSYKRGNELFCQRVSKNHALLLGTSGSGKSKYFLLPTIEANAFSSDETKPTLIINDLKGELMANSSKALKENGYNVICLNLRSPRKSTRFNPLDQIWDLYHKYIDSVKRKEPDSSYIDIVSAQIVEISQTLCPTSTGENKIWSEGSQSIIIGIIWGMLEDSVNSAYKMTKNKFTFQQIANIINRSTGEQLQEFLKQRPKSSRVFDYASMIIDNESEKTLASYISNTKAALTPFLEPGIQYITSASDFSLEEIEKQPTAIFIIIPDENKARYVLANAIITQLYNYLTYTASANEEMSLPRTVYFLLDEFGNMPKLPSFGQWISTSRARNIFFCIILQAISQLNSNYGKDASETILQNCQLQMYLGANEPSTLEYFQKQLGSYTAFNRTASVNEKNINDLSYNGSTGLTKKDLVTQEELKEIKSGEIYFMVTRQKPCHAHLVPFFDTELNSTGIFKKGSIDATTKEQIINFEEVTYSLEHRKEVYETHQDTDYFDDNDSHRDEQQIEEYTEQYNNADKDGLCTPQSDEKTVDTSEMAKLTHDQLEALGLIPTDNSPKEDKISDEDYLKSIANLGRIQGDD